MDAGTARVFPPCYSIPFKSLTQKGSGGQAFSTGGKGERRKDPLTLPSPPRGEGKRVCPLISILLR